MENVDEVGDVGAQGEAEDGSKTRRRLHAKNLNEKKIKKNEIR